jgi:predicted alpha/beta superfamily hydrolase
MEESITQHTDYHEGINADLLPKIRVISENFEIPQLILTRRIAALLPHDYDRTDKRYPVLYLQDGQNLFDESAPFGNWGVTKQLARMSARGLGEFIVIAIDHGGDKRIKEYTPSYETKLGSGDGKKYVRFLSDTLKPYIDKHFRTLPGREHTGIGGSSMGALISIYAGLMYPEVYSKLMIFSPALWVTPKIHFHFLNFGLPQDVKVYLYAGGDESETMVPNVKRFKQAFIEKTEQANFEIKLSVDPKGKHNEAYWGREFPYAAQWLFFEPK